MLTFDESDYLTLQFYVFVQIRLKTIPDLNKSAL